MTKNLQFFLNHNSNISHIFVDIFDTVLLRTTTPELQRFYQIAQNVKKALNAEGFTPLPKTKDIFLARVQGWRIAYDTAPINKLCREARLKDIIHLMCIALNLPSKLEPVLYQAELEYEATVLTPNKGLLSLLKWNQNAGRQIFYVSDMYFSEEDISYLFAKLIPSYSWDGGHISSTTGLSKRGGGALFNYILDKEKCLPENVLHMGDSLHSDVAMAEQVGVKAYYLPRHLLWRITASLRLKIFIFMLSLKSIKVMP